jgi:hypothetical protein
MLNKNSYITDPAGVAVTLETCIQDVPDSNFKQVAGDPGRDNGNFFLIFSKRMLG